MPAAVGSDGHRGLSQAEARGSNVMRNELPAEERVPAWRRFPT